MALHDLPPPPEVLSYPKRRPSKRRRKTTTPIPIEEEYLLTANNEAKKTTAEPMIVPSHRPENIEDIIEQEQTHDSMKIKHKVNIPPVLVIPIPTEPKLLVPVPTEETKVPANNTQLDSSYSVHENFTESLDTEMLTEHGKQNKIDARLSEPLLFVTAPQGVDFTALAKATTPVKIVPSKPFTTSSPVVVNVTQTAPNITVVTTTLNPTKELTTTNEIPKNTILKKIITSSVNASRETTRTTSTSTTSTTEKTNDVRKPIRRPPSVGTLFRKRFQPSSTSTTTTTTTTTETVAVLPEETTVSRENELAELKLYTESPIEIQKIEPAKLNEILPTSKINTFKPLKDNKVNEKNLGSNKNELKLKYISTSPAPVKHVQSSGTHAFTPNIDLIIHYTSSTRKPTTTSTRASIRIAEDETHNTISTSYSHESSNNSGEDEAVRFNLEIPQAKDDILIFLKSKAESNKLSKILQSRNMTLNELIEHRERGSSQLHLAEIFNKEPKPIPEADFDLPTPTSTEPPLNLFDSFPTSFSQENLQKEDRRVPKFLFDSMPQFPMQAEASQTIFTTKRLPELHYTQTRPLLPNAKLTPFYGSSEELLLSYTSSTGRPDLYGEDITIVREPDRRLPFRLKSVITISGAIIGFAVLGFFVLLISCKVRHRKAEKYMRHGMLREHMEATLRSSTRSDTPVVKSGYYAGCDHTSDTSSTARKQYLWKTIRKTFRYE